MKKGLHSKKRKLSFEKKDNSMNQINIQRILSVRRMNKDEKNKKIINKEIEEYFSSPEKYFQKNSPITIGKKIYILDMNDPRLRRGKKLKTEKKMTTNFFNNLVNYNDELAYRFSKVDMKGKDFVDINSKFEIIDNNRLKMIFDSYKIKDQKDNSINEKSQLSNLSDYSYSNKLTAEKFFPKKIKKIKNPSTSMDIIPKDIEKSLLFQTKKIKLYKLNEKRNNLMSKYLSKKTNKPLKNLLLNKIESYRFKKEVLNEIEYNKPFDEKYGKFKWNISLRRPDNFKGVRDSYINLKGERFMPFWSLVIERYPKQKELCVKPGYNLSKNEIKEFKRQNNQISSGKKNQYYKTVESLEDLSIEGKNLYNIEYKRELIDSKRKKILHKFFVENGKAISFSEVNNLYGNDIFCKDYKGFRTEKTRKVLKNIFKDKNNL